jgi:hypothetical protein
VDVVTVVEMEVVKWEIVGIKGTFHNISRMVSKGKTPEAVGVVNTPKHSSSFRSRFRSWRNTPLALTLICKPFNSSIISSNLD